jgi:hypothetical protein
LEIRASVRRAVTVRAQQPAAEPPKGQQEETKPEEGKKDETLEVYESIQVTGRDSDLLGVADSAS